MATCDEKPGLCYVTYFILNLCNQRLTKIQVESEILLGIVPIGEMQKSRAPS